MAQQSLLAKLGLRTGELGSAGDLAIAAPIADGDYDPAAHSYASRLGWYFDRTSGAEEIGSVVVGFQSLRIGTTYAVIEGSVSAGPIQIRLQNTDSSGWTSIRFNPALSEIGLFGSTYSPVGPVESADQTFIYSASAGGVGFLMAGNGSVRFGDYGNEWVRFWNDGGVQIGGAFSASPGLGALLVHSSTSSITPLTVRGGSGQSADLQQWQDNFSATLANVLADGSITTAGYIQASGAYNESTTTAGFYAGQSTGLGGSPRCMFANGTAADNWQIDNDAGVFRWFTPGVVRMTLTASSGDASLVIGTGPAMLGSASDLSIAGSLTVDTGNNLLVGTTNIATSATHGYLRLPTTAGTPTGVASPGAGSFVFDTTTDSVWVYGSGPGWHQFISGTGGTVTSVALALPVSVFTISGSPVTSTGTLTGSFNNQTANTVFAGPTTGVPAVPDFRALVAADLPAGTGTVISVGLSLPSFITVTGSPVTGTGTLTGTLATQTANTVFAGPTTGGASAPTFRALVAADITGALVGFTTVDNTGLGVGAGTALTSGVRNSFLGVNSGNAITSVNDTVAIGHHALTLATVGSLVAVGSGAANALTTSTGVTAIGTDALGAGVAGVTDCTAIGFNALLLATGNTNTAVGARAGDALTSGSSNTAMGVDALGTNSIGLGSTALGYHALMNSTGSANTAVGSGAADAVSTAVRIVAIGTDALGTGTTGVTDATAVGYNALIIATGAANTAIGSNAGSTITTGAGNILIGVDAGDGTVATTSNRFVAGSNTQAINNVWFGKGETNATPTSYTINGTGGSGSNVAGANLVIAGGMGTGTGAGGTVDIQVAPAGSTGSSLNALVSLVQFIPTSSGYTAFQRGVVYPAVSVSTNTNITTAHYVVLADTSAGNVTLTLPASPLNGQMLELSNVSGGTNTLTIAHNGNNIDGAAADLTTTTTNVNYTLVFVTGFGWKIL